MRGIKVVGNQSFLRTKMEINWHMSKWNKKVIKESNGAITLIF